VNVSVWPRAGWRFVSLRRSRRPYRQSTASWLRTALGQSRTRLKRRSCRIALSGRAHEDRRPARGGADRSRRWRLRQSVPRRCPSRRSICDGQCEERPITHHRRDALGRRGALQPISLDKALSGIRIGELDHRTKPAKLPEGIGTEGDAVSFGPEHGRYGGPARNRSGDRDGASCKR
jgi:hypothetical protein